jgi:diadenosine tetraphosphate (Ap4A) HIT family hydrolase
MPCPFCEKLTHLRELPDDELVWQFTHSIAFLGPWQYYHGYCILVSRRHATELSQLSAEEQVGYLQEMCRLARAIEECFRPHKLNYELLGNLVPHLHFHLFPRRADDAEVLRPVWFALDRAERDPAERRRLEMGPVPRSETTATLRRKLQELSAS